MNTLRISTNASLVVLGLGSLAGCCTTHSLRPDPQFPVAASPEHRYEVNSGDKRFNVDSIRFDGNWVILEGGYPGTKALWIPRGKVDWIMEPK